MGTKQESPTHTRHVLARCLGHEVTVTDFRCHACRHGLGTEEFNVDPSIVFVRRGVFVRRQDGESVVADASRMLFFNPQLPYRISHPVEGGDDCTILTLSPAVAFELIAHHAPHAAERSSCWPFLYSEGPAALDVWRMHYEILATVRGSSELALEDLVLRVLERIVGQTQSDGGETQRRISRRVKQRTAQRHKELAHTAAVAINRELTNPPNLTKLAAKLGCSSYHLSRVFRGVMGCSLRSYIATARARAAADAIARGTRGLTDLALRLGYVDHSHFTHAFSREWKMSPSDFRATMTDGAA